MNSKNYGDIAELAVATKFAQKRFIVSRPLSDNAPYDLIVDIEGQLYKVQVKARSTRKENISVELYSSMHNYTRKYQKGDFDILALYDINSEKIAIINYEDISNQSAVNFCMNNEKRASKNVKRIRFFDDYNIENIPIGRSR